MATAAGFCPLFYELAQRLFRVITLNRDWRSAVTPTVLQQTPTGPKPDVAIFLDPPYRTDTGRSKHLYQSDFDGNSDDAAESSYVWAREHGERYRIAYCCHEDDFPVPPGWDYHDFNFPGPNSTKKHDRVMFSPACLEPGELDKDDMQGALFPAREEAP